MKLSASLRFASGTTASGLASYHSMRRSLEGAEPEEVVLLLEVLDRGAVDRAELAVDQLVLGVVLLAGDAVEARGRCP